MDGVGGGGVRLRAIINFLEFQRGHLLTFWTGWALIGDWASVKFLDFQDGRLFEGGRLLTFWAFWVNAYSRWAVRRLIITVLKTLFEASIAGRQTDPNKVVGGYIFSQ